MLGAVIGVWEGLCALAGSIRLWSYFSTTTALCVSDAETSTEA